MANYSEDAADVYQDIADEGGPVTFKVYPELNPPDDPDKAWEGSAQLREDFPHVALFAPAAGSVQPEKLFIELAYIPAHKLTFPVIKGSQFETPTTRYNIEAVAVIRPDGVTPVLYICEVTSWVLT